MAIENLSYEYRNDFMHKSRFTVKTNSWCFEVLSMILLKAFYKDRNKELNLK